MDPKTILDQFLGYYYPTFASNRAGLLGLYVCPDLRIPVLVSPLFTQDQHTRL